MCANKFGGAKKNFASEGKDELISRLAAANGTPGSAAAPLYSRPGKRSNLNPSAGGSEGNLFFLLLKQVIESSFLPKLSAKGKEYCKMGQDLEIPFVKQLSKHSDKGITKFTIKSIYRVGLVAREGEMHVKASCDFIAGAIVNGEEVLVGVECKARVTPGTIQREHEVAESIQRQQRALSGMGTELYTIVDASSTEFSTYVDSSHESVQLMHQAYVYNFKYVLLLIGDKSGNIIRGKSAVS